MAESGPHSGPIEADNQINQSENDSSYGDEIASLTTSLSSSVTAYEYEHGRRFHAYEKGRYMFPNDEDEKDRMDLGHHIWQLAIDSRLFLSPVKNLQRVLDLGTGTGIWSIEVGDKHPSAEITGVDLSPIQPSWVPTNVHFEIDDIEKPWTYSTPFDLVFGRILCASVSDWPRLMHETYKNVKPGGWAEFHDYDLTWKSDDDTMAKDSSTKKWNDCFLEGCNKGGRDPCPGPKLKRYMEDAGFVNVVEEQRKFPIGTWAKDRKLKEIGAFNHTMCLEGLEAFSLGPFTRVLGWSIEEVQVLLANVRKELKNPKVHIYTDAYYVYGQKPEDKAK